MKLLERSYSGKIIRPKPHLHQEEDGSLLVIATAWGDPEQAAIVVDEIAKYVNAAREDVEVTSPFEFLTCLSDEANYPRIATLIANDQLYRSENRNEYKGGVEVLTLYKKGKQLAWAQIGNPSLFLKRGSQSLLPLSVSTDLSAQINSSFPPLPSDVLGLERTCNIRSGHVLIMPGDQLVLLASAGIPDSLLGVNQTLDLSSITNQMIQENSERPFWLGIVSV